METWATFSIIDHRKPVYRQALALFDKIVIPIPPNPIGDQTKKELEQLQADADYLVEKGAAKVFKWDTDAFQDWRRPLLAEAASAKVNRDIFLDTRLMLAEKVEVKEVQAIPVYGSPSQFKDSRITLMQVEQALTLEILQDLPVPPDDTPLENLISLRDKAAFRKALNELLDWKRLKAPGIFLSENRPQRWRLR
jgi:hypothetical protein